MLLYGVEINANTAERSQAILTWAYDLDRPSEKPLFAPDHLELVFVQEDDGYVAVAVNCDFTGEGETREAAASDLVAAISAYYGNTMGTRKAALDCAGTLVHA